MPGTMIMRGNGVLGALNNGWRAFTRILHGPAPAAPAAAPDAWNEKFSFDVSGLLDMGVDDKGRYLLSASHAGMELFDLESGLVVAPNPEDPGDSCAGIGGPEAEMEGFGPIRGIRLAMYGAFGREVPEDLIDQAEAITGEAYKLRSVLSARGGRLLIIGCSDRIRVLERKNSSA